MKPVKFRWHRILSLGTIIFFLLIFVYYQTQTIRAIRCIDKGMEYDNFRVYQSEHAQSTEKSDDPDNLFLKESISLSITELENNIVPNTIHYVWCHNRTLHFENYLSILSAWKFMQPDGIELHTKYELPRNEDKYNDWLEELEKTIPSFVIRRLPEHEAKDCSFIFGLDILLDRGGIYFSENLFVMKSFREFRKIDFSVAFNSDANNISFVMSIKGNTRKINHLKRLYIRNQFSEDSEGNNKLPNGSIFCENLNTQSNGMSEEPMCVEMSRVHPKDIFHTTTVFNEAARFLLYGDTREVYQRQELPGVIPKYVHLVWYNEKEMDFMMYLSLRSALSILKPVKVFIHGENALKGHYWERVKKDPRVVTVERERPTHVFGKKILYTQHKSDIIRADVLTKYGGIYMDWDVLWLKPIDDLVNAGYDAIVNFDHMAWPDYPDAFNLGVLMAKPDSIFVRKWQSSLVNYQSYDFFYNALLLPYKTYEKYPFSVHIEPKLQVMCYQLKCHPTFQKGYKNYNEEQPFDWKKVHAVHFTYPDPTEYSNETSLLSATGRFAEIGQFILKQPYD